MKETLPRHYEYPLVIEITGTKASLDRDDFLDGLSTPQKVAEVIDLNRNVIYLEDYKTGEAA